MAHLSTLAGGSDPAYASTPAPGSRLGRYVVRGELGKGAMGVVLRADDPLLDRAVAIKVLHRATEERAAHLSLLHEARALAQLSHPNVVQVFDVGTWCGRLFLAMELVVGTSLRHACSDRRTQSERIRMLLGAAQGLVAAHAAGIVHRDFKPDNVLVADNPNGADIGRVLVGDFGLALSLAPISTGRDDNDGSGVVAGTPAYMPPEQRTGGRIDARADQFAFCVTAVELLTGWRPHAIGLPEHHDELLARTRELPTALIAALARGLQFDPHDRAASMDDLLAALGRGSSLRIGKLAWAAPLALPLLCAWPERAPTSSPQLDVAAVATMDGDPIAAGLADALRTASLARFAANDVRGAVAVIEEALRVAQASGNSAAIVAALRERAHLRQRTSDPVGARDDIEQAHSLAIRDRLDDAAARTAMSAAILLSGDPDRRDDALNWLRQAEASGTLGPVQRAHVAAIRARIELAGGDIDDARRDVDVAVAELLEGASPPHDVAAALAAAADRWRARGEPTEPLFAIQDVCSTWGGLARLPEATATMRHVVDRIARVYGPDHVEVAIARSLLASYLGRVGDYDAARRELEPAIAVLERDPERDPKLLAISTYNLANVYYPNDPRGYELLLVAAARLARSHGAESPALVLPMVAIAQTERLRGDDDLARRHLEWALATAEQAYGPAHPTTTRVLAQLTLMYRDLENRERTRAMAERIVAVDATGDVPDNSYVNALASYAWSLERADPERAKALYRRELAQLELDDGVRDGNEIIISMQAEAHRRLAELEWASGDRKAAAALRERAIAIIVARHGADSDELRTASRPLGKLEVID